MSHRRDLPKRCSICDDRRHNSEKCTQISEVEKLYELDRLKPGINFKNYKFISVKVTTPGTQCEKCSKSNKKFRDEEEKCECMKLKVPVNPVESFEDLGLDENIHFNILDEKRCNFKVPTPIQRYALPVIVEGHDVMGCAQTGTGKTAAYIIPMVKLVVERGYRKTSVRRDEPQKPEVLIVAPTRELAKQIHNTALKLTLNMKHPCGIKVIYGGTKTQTQRDKIRQGCNILIGTPGRIKHFITDYTISMDRIEFLVLDEADKMVDDGFRGDLELIVDKTEMPPKTDRQTLMFSATFRSDLREIAAASMKKTFRLIEAGKIGSAQPDVEQKFEFVEIKGQKLNRLKDILQDLHAWAEKTFLDHKCWANAGTFGRPTQPNIEDYLSHMLGECANLKILIFAETKRGTEEIAESVSNNLYTFYKARFMKKFSYLYEESDDENVTVNYVAMYIHGGMSQGEREKTLRGFKDGLFPILVATNVAARGLDIEGVTHVINFDLPLNLSRLEKHFNEDTKDLKDGTIKRRPIRDQFEEYIHRIGRTGRAGNTGTSISFFQADIDRHLAISFTRMLEIAQQDAPDWLQIIAEEEAGIQNAGKKKDPKKVVVREALAALKTEKWDKEAGPSSEELWGKSRGNED